MREFSSLINELKQVGETYRADVDENWLQGRTLYGGLLAAYCLECAINAYRDLPPLRSAQFAFIGPTSAAVELRPSLLRRGKSAAFVGVDSVNESGLTARATLCFGASRAAAFCPVIAASPKVPSPEDCDPFPLSIPGLNFPRNFERRSARGSLPFSSSSQLTTAIWLRHRDQDVPTSLSSLIALADAALPAAMAFFDGYKPLSTMTWSVDMLSDKIQNQNGWWLVEVRADSLDDGYSSQAMTIWNSRIEPVMTCRQHIAVFA